MDDNIGGLQAGKCEKTRHFPSIIAKQWPACLTSCSHLQIRAGLENTQGSTDKTCHTDHQGEDCSWIPENI
jgi:hypothetical protein